MSPSGPPKLQLVGKPLPEFKHNKRQLPTTKNCENWLNRFSERLWPLEDTQHLRPTAATTLLWKYAISWTWSSIIFRVVLWYIYIFVYGIFSGRIGFNGSIISIHLYIASNSLQIGLSDSNTPTTRQTSRKWCFSYGTWWKQWRHLFQVSGQKAHRKKKCYNVTHPI